MSVGVIFSLLLLNVLGTTFGAPRVESFDCQFGVDLSSPSTPLISIENENVPIFKDTKYITLLKGERFTASCPNSNQFAFINKDILNLECLSGSIVKGSFGIANYTDLQCKAETHDGEIVTRTGTCYNGYTEVEVQFPSSNPPYTLITVCHNEELDETLYAKSYIFGALLDEMESGGNRPSFQEADFYSNITADECYKTANQIQTIGELLGSQSLANEYIKPNEQLFFSRGHLVPNGDPILQVEKHATFYFINALPQVQTINGGYWNQLEIQTRNLAGSRQATLTVWTGTYGITTLDDVNGNPVELWLGRLGGEADGELVKKLPINKYTWKVIFDEEQNEAVAIIQINNAWNTVTDDDVFCPDICSQISFVTWNTENVRLGYTFCCDVASFKEVVPYAPSLGDVSLLT